MPKNTQTQQGEEKWESFGETILVESGIPLWTGGSEVPDTFDDQVFTISAKHQEQNLPTRQRDLLQPIATDTQKSQNQKHKWAEMFLLAIAT